MRRIGSLYVTFHEEGDEGDDEKNIKEVWKTELRVWKFCPERKRGEWNLC